MPGANVGILLSCSLMHRLLNEQDDDGDDYEGDVSLEFYTYNKWTEVTAFCGLQRKNHQY